MTEADVPAFPVVDSVDGQLFGGLTKREYFAGLFLQGICSNSTVGTVNQKMVEGAIEIADAFIEALNAKEVEK